MTCPVGHDFDETACAECAYASGFAAGQFSMAGKNVQVQCSSCLGEGKLPHYRVAPGGPNGEMMVLVGYYLAEDPFHMVPCPTCRGHGFVIATELKTVTQWGPPPPRTV